MDDAEWDRLCEMAERRGWRMQWHPSEEVAANIVALVSPDKGGDFTVAGTEDAVLGAIRRRLQGQAAGPRVVPPMSSVQRTREHVYAAVPVGRNSREPASVIAQAAGMPKATTRWHLGMLRRDKRIVAEQDVRSATLHYWRHAPVVGLPRMT